MKVSVIGAGFVSDHLFYNKIPNKIDFSSKLIGNMLDEHKPDVLINCVGKTGRPNVDWCEVNREITSITNTALPIALAEQCAKKSIHLIHIGSGCIFFGDSPNKIPDRSSSIIIGDPPMKDCGWKETDFANPKSFYSKTKYAADLALEGMSNVTVLRIRMPVSSVNHPRNLLNKLKGYQKVIDIPNSMTFMKDLTRCIDWVVKGSHMGIYHVTNPQPLSAAQIMSEYQKHVPSHTFSVISESELDSLTIAKRSNCILNCEKLNSAGFFMTPAQEALAECMAEYVKNI